MPSDTVQFISVDEAIAIHERLIETFGGSPGLRDKGLLESAMYRPQTGYYQDLVEMAAALFESLLINHPFVDGNKRAAFFIMDVFLRMNGWKVDVTTKEGHQFIIHYLSSNNDDGFETAVAWLAKYLVRI